MRKNSPIVLTARAPRRQQRGGFFLAAAALALGAAGFMSSADAGAAMCASGACSPDAPETDSHRAWRYSTGLQRLGADRDVRRMELSEQDYSAFSGVGLIVCSAQGTTHASTAFLVGQFDIGVTVAHTFEFGVEDAEPQCSYNSMDSQGQIRERIPVTYVRSQWDAESGAAREPSKNFAVVRLAQPSRYAQRTMPLGRFSGEPAPALMIGFGQDVDADTVKRKVRGRVYGRREAPAGSPGYPHDIDSRDLAAGAPVIDERSGVIIGVHTAAGERRNAMISMNDWLESTLRAEMQAPKEGAEQAEAKAVD